MSNDGTAPAPPVSRKVIAAFLVGLAVQALNLLHLGIDPFEQGLITTGAASLAAFAVHEEETYLTQALNWLRAHHLA